LAKLESSLNLAHKDPNPLPAITVVRTLAHAYVLDGRLRLAENTFDELLDQLVATGLSERNVDLYCSTRWMRDRVYFFNDEFDRSLLSSDETRDLAERSGNRTMRFSAGTLLAHIAFNRGDYVEALRQLDEMWSLVAGVSQHLNAAVAAAIGILAKLALGHRDGFDQYLRLIMDRTDPAYELALSGHIVADALLATDEMARAESRARLAYERTSGRLRETHALLALAAVYLHKGENFRSEAATCYAQASALAETLGLRSALARAHSGEAEIAAAVGDTHNAVALFSHAESMWRILGMRHYESKARASGIEFSKATHSR
jgi:tetratricopeptide (TPR) repeat protein